ncbi:helix-turn-helix domain-containing protein [Emticicia sp. CRIBPO]|uniref:helix-turn-helix transcriptional regulator n=1 Tax=Emticicia sp. CRIBPO TaxID=2683258 RepID=UPI001412DE46|nr:helix-turn-helix transcriptional regulator [Emticicia sp. CRIBPO]NBA86872.1 helix-turn-helix domain-containing protein [Emticicia sp. CRIBPO]
MKNLLKLERARNNMTQAELATKVNVSRQTINSIEIGRYVPSTMLAFKIAFVLDTKVDALFSLEEGDWDSAN